MDQDPNRLKLHSLLQALAANVYFQPPSNMTLKYPAIVYERDSRYTIHANNGPYRSTKRYQVTIIDQNPDSIIPEKVAALPMSSFSRRFSTAQLNHDVYTLYF